MSETCLVHATDANRLIDEFWTALQLQDADLPDLPPEGVGEAHGAIVTVNWARSTVEPFFACQVLPGADRPGWEAGIAHAGHPHPVAFWRRIGALAAGDIPAPPAPWAQAIDNPHALEPIEPAVPPSFVRLLHLFAAKDIPSFFDDSGRRAILEDELGYWKAQAFEQARARRVERASFLAHKAAGPAPSNAGPDMPEAPAEWRLDQISGWVGENADRIVVLPRAIAAARKSNYHQPALVFEALELLAETYTAVKKGESDRTELKRRCDELGLSIGKTGEEGSGPRSGDEYYVRWRGQRRFLDQHLGRGNARDPRFSMRIYFTWCEVDQVVVVGWLPSHLSTGAS